MVSACSYPTDLIFAFHDDQFHTVVESLPSFVKYTTHLLHIFNDLPPSNGTSLVFTMYVKSLCTINPNADSLEVLHYFPRDVLQVILLLTPLFAWLNWSWHWTILISLEWNCPTQMFIYGILGHFVLFTPSCHSWNLQALHWWVLAMWSCLKLIWNLLFRHLATFIYP